MRRTKTLYLPGDGPQSVEAVSPGEMREHLNLIRTREATESPITQAANVGRAAIHLLGSRLYAQYPVSQRAMEPDEKPRTDPFIKYEVSLHNSTISGDPERVSLVATTRKPGKTESRVIALPQNEIAAEGFERQKSGLFVMDGTTRTSAWDEPELYSDRLVHSAGILLELMSQVEVVLPEAAELEDHIAA